MRILVSLLCFASLSTVAFAGSSLVVTDELTRKECSACHMAYPPVFLPARSWEAITGNLKEHFGEDASLSPEDTAAIKAYLVANAADASGKMRGFARGLPDNVLPLRITDLPRFKGEHNFSPATIKKVGSISNCVACHRGAEMGLFEDD